MGEEQSGDNARGEGGGETKKKTQLLAKKTINDREGETEKKRTDRQGQQTKVSR